MLIVEGIDGSGKTTLANQVAKIFDLQVIHTGGPASTPEQKYMDHAQTLETHRTIPGVKHIYDRFLWSEIIYGPILRGVTIQPKDIADLWRRMAPIGPLILYCRPPLEQVTANILTGEHLSGVKDHIETLYALYDFHLYNRQDVILYDFTEPHDHKMWDWIRWYMEQNGILAKSGPKV